MPARPASPGGSRDPAKETFRAAARLAEKDGDAIYLIERQGFPYAIVRDEFANSEDTIPETRFYNRNGSGADISDPAELAAIDQAIADVTSDWYQSFLIDHIERR